MDSAVGTARISARLVRQRVAGGRTTAHGGAQIAVGGALRRICGLEDRLEGATLQRNTPQNALRATLGDPVFAPNPGVTIDRVRPSGDS